MLRLKRVLMDVLADRGVDRPIPPDGPTVRMVDQEVVREQFYARRRLRARRSKSGISGPSQFKRALGLGRRAAADRHRGDRRHYLPVAEPARPRGGRAC